MSASHSSRPPSTPRRDPSQSEALSRSLQSTRPNKGSSSYREHLSDIKKTVIERGVAIDMKRSQKAGSIDLVKFVLAFCCEDDPSDVRDTQALNERFKECWKKVVPVANSGEMKKRLEEYKSTSSNERAMYAPLSNALNYGLERLSKIDVEGLPKFGDHIVFVPSDEGVKSDRDLEGSLFKPDIALMKLSTACDFRKIKGTRGLSVSRFVSKIPKEATPKRRPPKADPSTHVAKDDLSKNNPPQATPSFLISWKDILSAVEVKRISGKKWPKLETFTDEVVSPVNKDADEEPTTSRNPDRETPSDISESQTLTTSKSGKSKKRSAADAGISSVAQSIASKRQNRGPRLGYLNQTGTYAGEKLSDSCSVSHALNLLFQDDSLWISWVDREGVIVSSRIGLFKHLPLVLVLLLALQRFGDRQWGNIVELASAEHPILLHPVTEDGTLGTEEAGVSFHPEDKVHSGWSLLGRATTVIGASTEKNGDDGRAEDGRVEAQGDEGDDAAETTADEDLEEPETNEATSSASDAAGGEGKEQAPPDQARDAYRKACDEIINAHDLVLKIYWPETSRIQEWEIVVHAQALGKADRFIRGHVPEVKYARNFDQYSTRYIRDFLDLQHDKQTGTRTLRLVVMNRLRPLHDLSGGQMWDAFWECFACHYRLWVNGIRHGDISLNNLMYRVSPAGKVEGALNDYDLASWDKISTTNSDRTGTVPFMALNLLRGGLDRQIPRLYRHDAESFVWVLTYLTAITVEYRGHSAKISRPPDFDSWFRDDFRTHHTSKQAFYRKYGRAFQIPGHHEQYLPMVRKLITYWVDFDDALTDLEKAGLVGSEIDNPEGALEGLLKGVETALGADVQKGFTKVKALLLEAIKVPKVV